MPKSRPRPGSRAGIDHRARIMRPEGEDPTAVNRVDASVGGTTTEPLPKGATAEDWDDETIFETEDKGVGDEDETEVMTVEPSPEEMENKKFDEMVNRTQEHLKELATSSRTGIINEESLNTALNKLLVDAKPFFTGVYREKSDSDAAEDRFQSKILPQEVRIKMPNKSEVGIKIIVSENSAGKMIGFLPQNYPYEGSGQRLEQTQIKNIDTALVTPVEGEPLKIPEQKRPEPPKQKKHLGES